MGLAGQNQVRDMYVGDAPSGVSTLANLKSAGVASDLILLSADGSAVGAGKDFKLFQKDTLGKIASSDTVKASNVSDVRLVEYAAPSLKKYTIDTFTVDVNTFYTVSIQIQGHGSFSPEDTYLKQGHYKAVAADDAEAVVDGLIASLNRNFAREIGADASSNPYFSFSKTGSGATAALVIEGKEQASGFDGDKLIKIYDDFSVDISAETYPNVELTTPGSTGKGTGYQIVEAEKFLIRERGNVQGLNGYPYNLPIVGEYASVDKNYSVIEISYFDEGRNEAKKSKKNLTIAVPFSGVLAENSKLNTIIADINTILGAGTLTPLATS